MRLSKALVKLEHRSKDAYLRGMRHHQMEASWGPPVRFRCRRLRATCAHALVDCPGISDAELLTALLEPLTDSDKTVRMEAARAIAAGRRGERRAYSPSARLLGPNRAMKTSLKCWALSSPRCFRSKATRPSLWSQAP